MSPSFWSLEKAEVRQPLLILSPCLGIPENAGVTYQFRPLFSSHEGKGEAATSDFVLLFGDPREPRGYIAPVPSLGPPEKARVRQPLVIASPFWGTPTNAGVT